MPLPDDPIHAQMNTLPIPSSPAPSPGTVWVAIHKGKPAVVSIGSSDFCAILGSHTGDSLYNIELVSEIQVDKLCHEHQEAKLKKDSFIKALDEPYNPEGAESILDGYRLTTRRETCRGRLGTLWGKHVYMFSASQHTGGPAKGSWIGIECQCADNRTYLTKICQD